MAWKEYQAEREQLLREAEKSKSKKEGERRSSRSRRSPSAEESVGKLKMTKEMKEKLEHAVSGGGSRKSSVRSSTSDLDIGEDGVKKLAENRKILLEQKLGGGKLL